MNRKKRSIGIGCLIVMHLIFIALQIHHYSQFIRVSYQKQKNEKKYAQLLAYKQQVTQELLAKKNFESIEEEAKKQGMKRVPLSQVYTMSNDT